MEAIQIDSRVLFKITRQDDGLLTVRFFDTNGLPLNIIKDVLDDDIDKTVDGFLPNEEKMQILIYPNESWFKNGCPETRFTRKFNLRSLA